MATDCIAQVRIDDSATVKVLRIAPNEVLTCDRNCSGLEESRNGSVQCCVGYVKKIVNFQTKALVIDFEVNVDRKADSEWRVRGYDFHVVDEKGQIFEGRTICDRMVSPEILSRGISTLYPGTKGQFRVYFDEFPENGVVSSIIVDGYSASAGRIDLLAPPPEEIDFEEERQELAIPVQQPDDLRERVETLEREVSHLKSLVRTLTELKAMKKDYENNPKRPMHDPGISYKPLDNK